MRIQFRLSFPNATLQNQQNLKVSSSNVKWGQRNNQHAGSHRRQQYCNTNLQQQTNLGNIESGLGQGQGYIPMTAANTIQFRLSFPKAIVRNQSPSECDRYGPRNERHQVGCMPVGVVWTWMSCGRSCRVDVGVGGREANANARKRNQTSEMQACNKGCSRGYSVPGGTQSSGSRRGQASKSKTTHGGANAKGGLERKNAEQRKGAPLRVSAWGLLYKPVPTRASRG